MPFGISWVFEEKYIGRGHIKPQALYQVPSDWTEMIDIIIVMSHARPKLQQYNCLFKSSFILEQEKRRLYDHDLRCPCGRYNPAAERHYTSRKRQDYIYGQEEHSSTRQK